MDWRYERKKMKIEKQNKKVNQELKMANKQKKKEIENNYGVYF